MWNKPSQQDKKRFCIIASLQWILLSGLRHVSVGADTYAYKVYSFDLTIYKTWENLFEDFVNILFRGGLGKDPGYPIIEKAVQIFTTNYQVFLIIIALIFTIPLGIWIYKNSPEPLISFLIYSCLFYAFFSITGHRQTIATALVVLIGYKFIKERKFWFFLLLVIIAVTIHKSAICFLPFYFIAHKKITKRYLVLFAAISSILLTLGKTFYAPIAKFLGYEEFIENTIGGTGTYVFLVVLVMLVGLWRMPIILKNNPKANIVYNAMFIGTFGALMAYQNQSFMRLQQYYTLFIMLLIPEIIGSFSKKERVIVYQVTVVLLVLLFARSNPQYTFFWKE